MILGGATEFKKYSNLAPNPSETQNPVLKKSLEKLNIIQTTGDDFSIVI